MFFMLNPKKINVFLASQIWIMRQKNTVVVYVSCSLMYRKNTGNKFILQHVMTIEILIL